MEKHKAANMALIALSFVSLITFASSTAVTSKIGVNYGRIGDNLPSPYQSIQLLLNMKAGRVKLYDANPEILRLLSGTKLEVSIMVTNDIILSIASNQAIADQWVLQNVLAYYPNTMIRYILVGNEVLSYNTPRDQQNWYALVPAMWRIKNSLKALNIRNIKIGTPLAMDVMESSFPPSSGRFRADIREQVMVPLLQFLNRTKSFFFLDVYPYFPYAANPTARSLDFALFRGERQPFVDPYSGLIYTNLLDQMLDSVVFGMSRLGFGNILLAMAETGWPNAGDANQPGANIPNAATYNANLINRITAVPPIGTPARPGIIIPTFIFSLFDENQKSGPGTERHWGMLHPDGTPVYEVDLTGHRGEHGHGHGHGPSPTPNQPQRQETWCVVGSGVNLTQLSSMLTFVCTRGDGTCGPIEPGRECYEPVSLVTHASYAFSSYWAKYLGAGVTCSYDGLAIQSTMDPSHGSCKFPSVIL